MGIKTYTRYEHDYDKAYTWDYKEYIQKFRVNGNTGISLNWLGFVKTKDVIILDVKGLFSFICPDVIPANGSDWILKVTPHRERMDSTYSKSLMVNVDTYYMMSTGIPCKSITEVSGSVVDFIKKTGLSSCKSWPSFHFEKYAFVGLTRSL